MSCCQGAHSLQPRLPARESDDPVRYYRYDLRCYNVEPKPERQTPTRTPHIVDKLPQQTTMLGAESAREDHEADLVAHLGKQQIEGRQADQTFHITKHDDFRLRRT